MRATLRHIRTFLIVTVIAVLVWMYAENENVKTYPREPIRLKFVAPEGQTLAIEPTEVRANITVRGNNAQIQAFRSMVKQGPIEIPVEANDDPNDPSQSIALSQRLGETRLAELNMNLLEIEPQAQGLEVRRLQEVLLPVEIVRGDLTTPPDQPPVAVPSEVRVVVPESLVSAAKTLRAQVRLDEAPVNRDRMDVEQRATAAVELPVSLRSRWTELKDKTAQVTYILEDRRVVTTDTLELPNRGVRVAYAPENGERHRFELAESDRFIRDLRLEGPIDQIARMRETDAPSVMAIAPLTSDNIAAAVATGGRVQVPVQIMTPPGIRVVSQVPSVTVIVRPITPPTE